MGYYLIEVIEILKKYDIFVRRLTIPLNLKTLL